MKIIRGIVGVQVLCANHGILIGFVFPGDLRERSRGSQLETRRSTTFYMEPNIVDGKRVLVMGMGTGIEQI
jgi:hypothetical protein